MAERRAVGRIHAVRVVGPIGHTVCARSAGRRVQEPADEEQAAQVVDVPPREAEGMRLVIPCVSRELVRSPSTHRVSAQQASCQFRCASKVVCLLTDLSANDVELSPELLKDAKRTLFLHVSAPQSWHTSVVVQNDAIVACSLRWVYSWCSTPALRRPREWQPFYLTSFRIPAQTQFSSQIATGTTHSHFGGVSGMTSSSLNRPICPTRL